MAYPDIHLTRPIRRTIMITLIAAFFILSPIIILYTAGYRYDIETKQVEQTGVLSIDAVPADATVTVGATVIGKRMPIRLSNRAPGTYHVKIEKEGYLSWEQDIIVRSKETSYIRDVELTKISLPEFVQEAPSSTTFIMSPDGAYFFELEQDHPVYTLTLHDIAQQVEMPILSESLFRPPLIEWSPYGSYAAVYYGNGIRQTGTLALIDASASAPVTELIPIDTRVKPHPRWNSNADVPSGFIRDSEGIVTVANNVRVGDNQNLFVEWHVDEEQQIFSLDSKEQKLYVTDTDSADDQFVVSTQMKHILTANTDRVIGTSDQGNIILLELTQQPNDSFVAEEQVLGILDYAYAPLTEQWLLWSTAEVWVIDTTSELDLLNRTSEHIDTVHVLNEYGALLLADQKTLRTFHPGYGVGHTILTAEELEVIGVDVQERYIYFTGVIGTKHGLYRLGY